MASSLLAAKNLIEFGQYLSKKVAYKKNKFMEKWYP